MDAQPGSGRGDIVAGLCVTVLGLGYTGVALGTPADPSTASVIGPGVVPTMLGALMAVGGIALAVAGAIAVRRHQASLPEDGARRGSASDEAGSGQRFWVLFALLAAYVVAFIPLGYLLSTAAFLMAMTSYVTPRRLLGNAVFSLVFPVAVYVLFGYALRVSLPSGVLVGVMG